MLYQPAPERRFDQNFNLETETFADKVDLLVSGVMPTDTNANGVEVTTDVRYQACSDRQCLPPRSKIASFEFLLDAAAPATPRMDIPAGYKVISRSMGRAALTHETKTAVEAPKGGLLFLITAFGLGFAAVFTPCVFPMIPITISFFLHRRGGIAQAATFAFGIVFLFCGLGLGITALTGPFGVVRLGANPWVNGFIAVVFGVFALSLLGAFEITLPSGLLTRLDRLSRQDGYLGTLFMGLTFSLTSFACVGPFVGSLLAASVQAPGSRTLLGMLSFSTGLSLPFFLLAAFPSYLKKLPKAGDWMMRVKVVMGFVLLAAMLKYISNVDQVLQLGILSRERIVAAWLVLFSLTGFYLLGFLRLAGVNSEERLGVGRLMTAALFLTFACSLAAGVAGSGLGEIEAWLPIPSSGGPPSRSGESLTWLRNTYGEALAQARQQNKSVLVTFTGYACTNCHWMKANMFTQPEVAAEMRNFILVDLYTDGSDAASIGNQQMQSSKYGTVAIPFYAIVSPDGNTVSTFPGLTRDASEWLTFLKRGVLETSDISGVSPTELAAAARHDGTVKE
jgi:thiol:disulfide interchange protein DsbD